MRPELLSALFRHIETLKGVGPKSVKLIKKLCGENVLSILFHLPQNIVFRPQSNQLGIGIMTVCVEVISHITPVNKKMPYKIICGRHPMTAATKNAPKPYQSALYF